MRILNAPTLLEEIFAREPELPSTVQSIELLARGHADVYRVVAGSDRFVAHISRNGTEYLKRLRANLTRVQFLGKAQVPQVVAWCQADAGHSWSVLICTEVAGRELDRKNASPNGLASLADVLFRLHAVEAPVERRDGILFTADDAAGFGAFSETLLARLADLPVNRERVAAHLRSMAGYLEEHVSAFSGVSRLIHGDLHRSNIVIDGGRVGLIDWSDLSGGDYAYDLATLKFVLDSVAPSLSSEFIRRRACLYREQFDDGTLETRLRFFLSLAGLVRAIHCADDTEALQLSRAWRVRACYLHSEAQWRSPLRLDGTTVGAPAVRTEEFAVDMRQPMRGLFYLVAPKRVS